MTTLKPGSVCLGLVLLCLPVLVFAQNSTSTTEAVKPQFITETIPGTDVQIGDFVVGPGKLEVTVRPGETVVREITVTNRIDTNRTFEFHVEDMSGSASGDEAVVLLGDQNGPYSLKNFVTVPAPHITLGLGERARVPVTITMPADAEPGGYYGAVLVSTIQDKDTEVDNTIARSPIVARIGTLFFITVPGEASKNANFERFSTIDNKQFYSKGPLNFGITYNNTGSVHLNPYGEMRITNIFGAEVGFVELDPWFVLPKSLRTREVTWNREFLLGVYKVTANINRGYDDIVDTKSFYVFVLPWQVVLPVLILLVLLVSLLRWFFNKFEFRRK